MDNYKLNFDNFGNNKNGRFQNGYTMKMIITNDSPSDLINSKSIYSFARRNCCSEVQNTNWNWYYQIKEVEDKPLLYKWIEEISPIFPSLNLKFIKIPKNKISGEDQLFQERPINEYNNGFMLNVELPCILSSLEHYSFFSNIVYNSTHKEKQDNVKYMGVASLFSTIYLFIKYCAKKHEDPSILSKSSLTILIKDFIINNKSDVFESFNTNLRVHHNPYGYYWIKEKNLINTDILEKDFSALVTYIKSVIDLNKSVIQYYYLEELNVFDIENYIVLQALYRNKDYKIEAYLAHILIRAGFSKETIPFIKQYFYIKEKTPNLYFWNRIFLTQMGFNFHFYFWLTGYRFFKFTNEEEFISKAKNFGNYSSECFFGNNFKLDLPLVIRNAIKALYLEEKFDIIIKSLSNSIKVIPNDNLKNAKNSNFRLFSSYIVSVYDDNYYYILADNYRIRRCKKTNFNIIEE